MPAIAPTTASAPRREIYALSFNKLGVHGHLTCGIVCVRSSKAGNQFEPIREEFCAEVWTLVARATSATSRAEPLSQLCSSQIPAFFHFRKKEKQAEARA